MKRSSIKAIVTVEKHKGIRSLTFIDDRPFIASTRGPYKYWHAGSCLRKISQPLPPMASLRGLLEDYSAAEECTTIVHFPSTDDTSILSLPRLIPPVPYAAATALDLYTQDQLPRIYPLARMLETLSGALPISRFAPGWGPNGQLSMTHLDLCVVDVEAMYYPTHALFAFSPNDTTQMTLYLVHCVVLWVFCPAFYDKLPYSPIQEDIFSPTIIPRCITVPVHPFCIAYPEALGIFLPYFYLRDTRTLVCQCLPLLDWISRNDDNIIATLQDKSVGESLGYALAQEVPFQTLVEFTVKTYSLSLSAWDMTIQVRLSSRTRSVSPQSKLNGRGHTGSWHSVTVTRSLRSKLTSLPRMAELHTSLE